MKEYVKQPEHKAGTAGKEPQARKQAPLGELLQAYRSNSPAQPKEMENKGDAGEELNAVLENLEMAVMQAMRIPGQEAEKKDAFELAERLRQLHIIADGNNEEAKSALLEGLKEELEMAGSPPALANVPPIQRMKGWQKALIGTAVVIGLGALLYKLYKNITNRQEEVTEDGTDTDMHGDEISGIDIPKELRKGITKLMSVEEIANRIFENVNKFEFVYDGWYYPVQMSMEGHVGDCRSLVEIYELVASRFGVPTVRRSIADWMLVNPGPIHGREAQGNTAGESYWFFQNHYWVEVCGTSYDLLFKVKSPPAPAFVSFTDEYNNVSYCGFNNGCFFIHNHDFPSGYKKKVIGIVFPDETAVRKFVDECLESE